MQERAIVAGPPATSEDIADNEVQHVVALLPAGLRFRTAPGRSLLQAADDAGIELPSSCRNGSCRTCLCRCTAGRFRHLIPWPGVTREEQAEGWLLPCVAQALSDVVLEVPHARDLFA